MRRLVLGLSFDFREYEFDPSFAGASPRGKQKERPLQPEKFAKDGKQRPRFSQQ